MSIRVLSLFFLMRTVRTDKLKPTRFWKYSRQLRVTDVEQLGLTQKGEGRRQLWGSGQSPQRTATCLLCALRVRRGTDLPDSSSPRLVCGSVGRRGLRGGHLPSKPFQGSLCWGRGRSRGKSGFLIQERGRIAVHDSTTDTHFTPPKEISPKP